VTGQVSFSVTVPGSYTAPVVANEGCLKLGNADCFDEDDHTTLVLGTAAIQGSVFADTDVLGNAIYETATESGIQNVAVSLYYDANGDGDYTDVGDFLVSTVNSTGAAGDYSFTQLPATSGPAEYIVVVDIMDPDLITGYGLTTLSEYTSITLAAGDTYGDEADEPSDFGFAPALSLDKRVDTTGTIVVGDTIQYTIAVTNILPGSGGPGSSCVYNSWATSEGGESSTGTNNVRFYNFPGQSPPNPSNSFNNVGPDSLYSFGDFSASGAQTLAGTGFVLGNQEGNITNVKMRVKYYLSVALNNDQSQIYYYSGGNPYMITTFTTAIMNTYVGSSNPGWLEVDLGATNSATGSAWQWSDFASGNDIQVVYQNDKINAGDPSLIYIDAIGMEITTDGTCGGSNKVLNLVPLTDTFDDAYFDFISADPPVSSSGTGILTWNNIGPLYPGQTRFITVNMRAAQAGTTTATDNIATSAGSLFSNGLPANSPESGIATVTIGANANTRTFSGTIFDDNSSPVNGWSGAAWTRAGSETGMDAVDTRLRGVKVDLYGCYDASTGALVTGSSSNPCSTAASGNDGVWRLVRTTYTDANGDYLFQNLGQGYYYAWVDTSTIIGSQVADVNQAGVCTTCDSLSNVPATDNLNAAFVGNLSANTSVARVNFGYNVTGSYNIGDLLFYDWDGDGVQDAGDEGLSGATVRLLDPNGAEIATSTTAQDGSYLFSGYPNGIYTVQVDTSTLTSGLVQSLDPEDDYDNLSRFTLNGADDLTRDFAYQPTGSGTIGDTVWRDMNGDSAQSGTQETGIAGVTVQLQVDLNGDGTYVTLATDTTDSNGNYLFEGLPLGASYNYSVALELDGANLGTIPNDVYGNDYYNTTGTLDTIPSPDIIYRTASLTGASPNDLSADFGFAPPASMGDTIFWDSNSNGTQDAGEPGIPDAKVDLYTFFDANSNYRYDPGEIVTYFGTDYTDAVGKYLFSGLVPDYYVVIVDTTTAGYDPGSGTVANPILNPTLTSDPSTDGVPQSCSIDTNNPLCDARDGMRLYANTNYMGADFGFQPTGVIGDTLWIDSDNDGVQDPGEAGIADIDVYLCDSTDMLPCTSVNANETATTDANGNYIFENIPDGTYYIEVDEADSDFPSGLNQTFERNNGGTGDNDVANPDKQTKVVLSGGVVASVNDTACATCSLDVDFGYRYQGPYNLSGTVCLDESTDGTCDASESAYYQNVLVSLVLWNDDGDGNIEPGEATVLDTQYTDANGDYSFAGYPDGDYYVSVSNLPDYLNLTTDAGETQQNNISSTTSGGYVVTAQQQITLSGASVPEVDFAFSQTLPTLDYGDLPDVYKTLYASQGPSHTVPGTPSLYLGAAVDAETNGLPGVDADGDNNTGGDDEDGVTFNSPGTWVGGVNADAITVNVTGSGYLYGWMDINNDSDFSDAGEKIITSSGLVTGSNNYSLDLSGVFGNNADVELYSRFRILEAQPLIPGLAYFGDAGDGEVEDYVISWRMTVDKDTNTPIVSPGGQAEYAVVVSNTGNQTLTGVQISDNLDNIRNPGDFTFASMSAPVEVNAIRTATSDPLVGATSLTWGTWDINPGGSVALVFRVSVSASIPADAATSYDNTVSVTSDQLGTLDDDGTIANDPNTPANPTTDPEDDEDIVVDLNPDLTVTKTNNATGSIVVVNGSFDWTITATNSAVTVSFADSVVILRDTLPGVSGYYPQGALTVTNGATPPNGTIDCAISGVTLECVANGTVDMVDGASFSVTLAVTPSAAGTLVNTATVDPDGTIAEGNEGNNTASDTVSVFDARPSKSIVATSEPSTGFVSGTERVAIGEMVRYRISALIQEGSFTNLQLVDNLPNGLQFLDDGTARFALVSNGGGITSSALACANDSGNAVDTASLPSANVDCALPGAISSGPFGSGDNVTFSLGDLTNADADADSEYVVVEFNALVLNENSSVTINQGTDNQDASNVTNFRSNNASLLINGITVGSASPNVTVSISEPAIVSITKSVAPVASAYLPGDTLTYTLTFVNDTLGQTNAATAFDIQLTDTVDANLGLSGVGAISVTSTQGVSGVDTCAGGAPFAASTSLLGQVVTVDVSCLDPGNQVQVTIEATVNSGTASGTDITNDASLVYTSLPGAQGNCSTAPFDCTGVGGTGTGTGERNGSGGAGADSAVLNNYVAASNTLTSTVAYGSITIVKDAVPDDAQDFAFTGDASFSLDDDTDGTLSNTQTYATILPGAYTLTEGAVTGWSLTDLNCSGDTDSGSTLTLATRTAEIDLDAGEDITCTFTNTRGAVISDYVWDDVNGDGAQAGETGLDGVRVYIDLDGDNTYDVGEPTDVTAGGGLYSIGGLAAGTYAVRIDTTTLPGGYVQTYDLDGTGTAHETSVTVTAGETRTDVDFGYQQQNATISNYVWDDANGDGAQTGEIGLDGVRVYIDLDGDNTYDVGEPTDVTAGGGLYSIGGLAAGTYDVRIDTTTLPAGYAQTYDLDGIGTTHEAGVTVVAGETRTDVDFGYQQQNAVVSDYVWDDADGDGVQDGGETGIDGVRVFIDLDGDNTYDVGEPTDVTAGGGLYSIGNLPAGAYTVRVVTASLPTGGYIQTYDLDGTLDNETKVPLSAGQIRTDVDFGYQPQNPTIQVTKSITSVTFDSPQMLRITYAILVENAGNVPLTNVQVTDDLAITFASATSFNIASVFSSSFTTNPGYDGNTDTDLLAGTDTLAVGANGTVTLVILVDTGGQADTYTNTAIAQGTPPVGSDVQDSDSVPGPSFIDPAVTKAVDPSQAAVGETVTFTITVSNNGNVNATGVVITDTLPDNLDYVSATAIDTATSLARGTITLLPPRTVQVDIGELAVTDVIEITIVTQVNALGQPPVQNTARLVSDPPPADISPDPVSNNTSQVELQIGTPSDDDVSNVRSLPATGFAPNKVTPLPEQPVEQSYADLGDFWLEVPSLGVKTPIVGVPTMAGAWNVDWLWEQAGWLQGTAFPTWQGNSVLTGHVYLPNGRPGPFVNLPRLRWGDEIIVHAFGQRHVYEVRMNRVDMPNDLSALWHEDQAWLTLITCRGYDETSNVYKYRIVTRAVLMKIEAER